MPDRPPILRPLALALLLAAPAAAAPDRPDTRPTTQPASQPATRHAGRPDRSDRRDGDERRAHYTPEDLAQAEGFFEEHAPRRYEYYRKMADRLGADSDRGKGLRARIVSRYRELQNYRQSNPKLYDFLVKQLSLEDEVRAAAWRAGKSPDDPKLRDALRTAVRQLVENYLDARHARIEKLRADLAKEEADLKRDRENVDQLVDDRVKHMRREGE